MFAGILTPSSISVVFEPFSNFMALPSHLNLEFFPVRSVFACKFCWKNVDDLGLLCLIAYSLITIDKQQTCWACFGCFVKSPTCWRKLWQSLWWIEIHKMCFETVKEPGEFEIKLEYSELVNWNTVDFWFHWQTLAFFHYAVSTVNDNSAVETRNYSITGL